MNNTQTPDVELKSITKEFRTNKNVVGFCLGTENGEFVIQAMIKKGCNDVPDFYEDVRVIKHFQ